MKALAASRRHRLAPLVLVLLALLLAGLAYQALAPRPAAAEVAGADQIEYGRELFVANCASCHGINAEGGAAGPSLIGVGAASVDFQVSTGRMPMVRNGPQAHQKPAQMTAEQTAALAAYVASLGAGPPIPSEEMVDAADGDPAHGAELFRINCAQCHNNIGAGGALSEGKWAPSLLETDPVHVYEAMLTGPQSMPVFNDANITPEEKRDIIAYLVEQRGTSAGGLTLGGLGAVSEGLWAWIAGIAVLITTAVWFGARSS